VVAGTPTPEDMVTRRSRRLAAKQQSGRKLYDWTEGDEFEDEEVQQGPKKAEPKQTRGRSTRAAEGRASPAHYQVHHQYYQKFSC
jgi:hypothetical protein